MAWGKIATALLMTLLSLPLHATTLEQQRALYQQARQALKSGHTNRYYPLRKQLEGYPLTPYLDYQYRRAQIPQLSAQQAVEILQELAPTPLYNQFKHHFLTDRGRRQDWQAYLILSPEPPNSEVLRCYYYRARLATGDHAIAWQGAEQLWLSGRSRDKACDPLFTAWKKAGKRSNELIWQRMLLAFDASQYSLVRYLNSLLSQPYRRQGDLLLKLYRDPAQLKQQQNVLKRADQTGAQIASLALQRQARSSPSKAWRQWRSVEAMLGDFRTEAAHTLLYYSLLENNWSDDHEALLLALPKDNLLILRTRRAIFEADWDGVQTYYASLSETTQNKAEWQYWHAYSAAQMGQPNFAQQRWAALAKRRNFYGFLAAQHLALPYAMQSQQPYFSPEDYQQTMALAGPQRLQELMALEKWQDARNEIRWQIPRLSAEQQAALMAMAHSNQWHFLTVEGTIQAKMWDALEWRFPTAYSNHFEQFANLRQLDIALLQAVARRESALYPKARSHADAYGLMQLLPSTAKSTAKKIGAPYHGSRDLYQPKRNIQLGSAYYQELYQRYDGNRLLASAAYNAGPHRVSRWLNRSDGQLDAARFVATIPFRETREYVEAILSYQLIYAKLNGRSLALMTEQEQTRAY
ncbi:transglycosylase SLT domain-containing protein [Ferrimonas pelagia]|uniref:Transglycosylase SLT domain-containing protein n=1 Tax=Ferrimonas pelagia TaxID=1177826 RepID=A0ABP9F2W8_9GAMM